MNLASADLPPEESEFDFAGLTPAESVRVRSPRIAEAPISMECTLVQSLKIGQSPNSVFIGEIVMYHAAGGLLEGQVVDVNRLKPVGRLGEFLYCNVRDIFEMKRPRL
jgi:flavin reductase (DIM6/NTAB) family NADH-FMN oxidoreductase RutF